MQIVNEIAFFTILSALICGWVATGLLLKRIRENYPDAYDELGAPKFGNLFSRWPSDFPLQWRFLKFMFSGTYRMLGDGKIRILGIFYFLSIGLIILSFLALVFIGRK